MEAPRRASDVLAKRRPEQRTSSIIHKPKLEPNEQRPGLASSRGTRGSAAALSSAAAGTTFIACARPTTPIHYFHLKRPTRCLANSMPGQLGAWPGPIGAILARVAAAGAAGSRSWNKVASRSGTGPWLGKQSQPGTLMSCWSRRRPANLFASTWPRLRHWEALGLDRLAQSVGPLAARHDRLLLRASCEFINAKAPESSARAEAPTSSTDSLAGPRKWSLREARRSSSAKRRATHAQEQWAASRTALVGH